MRSGGDLKGRLVELLRVLHLPGLRECFEEEAERATREGLSHEQYLLELVEREVELRQQSRVGRLLRESRLPLEKSLEAFDLKRLPRKLSTALPRLRCYSARPIASCRLLPSIYDGRSMP